MKQNESKQYNFRLDLHGAYVPGTNLQNTNLEDANLSGADFINANFRGANFKNANLVGAILRDADFTGATNLTEQQLTAAIIDEHTKLPHLSPALAAAK